jgi:hypothetical protein
MSIEMNKEFAVHMLNQAGKEKAAAIADAFNWALEKLKMVCPENTREFSICKTKLEEACFFAKKAMASAPGNTDVQSEESK